MKEKKDKESTGGGGGGDGTAEQHTYKTALPKWSVYSRTGKCGKYYYQAAAVGKKSASSGQQCR